MRDVDDKECDCIVHRVVDDRRDQGRARDNQIGENKSDYRRRKQPVYVEMKETEKESRQQDRPGFSQSVHESTQEESTEQSFLTDGRCNCKNEEHQNNTFTLLDGENCLHSI